MFTRHKMCSNKILYKSWDSFIDKFQKREDKPVFAYRTPEELKRELDLTLPLKTLGKIDKELEKILDLVIRYTPDLWSCNYSGYLYSSPDPVGLIGDWLVSLLNTNIHAYEASPILTLVEIELIKAFAECIGYGQSSDGIFCPGGSYSNMFAMYLARERLYPDVTNESLKNKKRLIVFTSEQAHYSVDRAAMLLGLGKESVRKIKCDSHGRMIAKELDQKVKEAVNNGEEPFFVNATIGTTVLGGFDPLNKILCILQSYPGTWLHVDAAWGGAVLMSEKYRGSAMGIEQADSITWDLHKCLNAPLLCSALLVKDRSTLKNIFDVEDSYLFHDNKEEENYNLGKKIPQCGRRGDAFKFWLMWKLRGKEYFTRQVEKAFIETTEVVKLLKTMKCFWIYDDRPDFLNVCFWYVPVHLRHLAGINQCSKKESAELEEATMRVYESMKRDGRVFVNYAKIKNNPAFIRLILSHRDLNHEHIKHILEVIESLGDKQFKPGTKFMGSHKKLKCLFTGEELIDDGLILSNPASKKPALLRAIYFNKKLEVHDNLPGLYKYSDWLPIRRILKNSSSPITYKSKGLAKELELSNLYVTFSGYWPEKGCEMSTGSFKECEAFSVCARIPTNIKDVLVVASAGNTARAFARVCSENDIPLLLVVPEENLNALWFDKEMAPCVNLIACREADYCDAINLAEIICQQDGFIPEGGAKNVARRDGMGTTLLSAVTTIGDIPDYYFQAVGSGTGAIAAWEANMRLIESGLYTNKKMSLQVSQNIPFIPIYESWKNCSRELIEIEEEIAKKQILEIRAKVLSNRKPSYSIIGGLYDALVDTHGNVYAITNEELDAARELFEDVEGIDICPEAGVVVASLVNALKLGKIDKKSIIMLNITGGGIKRFKQEKRIRYLSPVCTIMKEDFSPEIIQKVREKVLWI